MSILGSCGNCIYSRMGEQLGGAGTFCHYGPPAFHMIPQGPNKMQMVGFWAPVDRETGWCGKHELAPAANTN